MIAAEKGPGNSGMVSAAVEFHYVDQEDDVLACYPLIRQLRPHLDNVVIRIAALAGTAISAATAAISGSVFIFPPILLTAAQNSSI